MRFSVRSMAIVSLFSVLTAVSAQIRIPFPIVPMTLHVFVVLLAGMLLGPKNGALSQLLYFLLGVLGLPFFAGGGGVQIFLSPTIGYLVGFVIASWVAGSIVWKIDIPKENIFLYGIAAFVGLFVIYCMGMVGLYVNLNLIAGKAVSWFGVFKIGVMPFLLFDIIKGIGATFFAWRIVPLLQKSGFITI